MRVPYRNNRQSGYNGGGRRDSYSRGNPFDGASEADIVSLTERVLNDDRNIGYVTSDGRVMPRNDAFASGYKDGLELIKERVWGGESEKTEEPCESNEADEKEVSVELCFSEEAKTAIYLESLAVNSVETGGALIGNWAREADGTIVVNVERASGPGLNATRKPALFSPALEYYRARVNYYRQTRNWEYIGEWHKHPGDFDSLSATDMETAKAIMREEGWPLILIPIVSRKGGRLFIDNYIALSRQLGGERVLHAGGFDLNDLGRLTEMKAYIDDELLRSFRASPEKSAEFFGIHNPGESYVFVPSPGQKNARLRLLRAGEDVPFSDSDGCVTAVVGETEVRCYHVKEGEILPLPYIPIDPGVSIYERNAGLTETSALRDKTVTLVGCGSLGSSLALALARAGVGSLHLFDYDILSNVNRLREK